MTMSKGLVYDASGSDPADWAALEAELDDVFRMTQEAVLAGEPIVYVVHEPSVWGHAAPLRAALATALMGGARSAAVEGARSGLAANVVATDESVDSTQLADTIEFLLTSGLTGQVLTCGTTHLGRPAA
jgi:hypothetical protein